jgi:hypothetical protein
VLGSRTDYTAARSLALLTAVPIAPSMLLRHAEDPFAQRRRRQRAFFFASSAPQTPAKAVVFKRSVRTMCRLVLYININNIHRIIACIYIYILRARRTIGFFFRQTSVSRRLQRTRGHWFPPSALCTGSVVFPYTKRRSWSRYQRIHTFRLLLFHRVMYDIIITNS